MRLFAYYALHTFKNQLKKLLKTWVLIFLLVCMLLGVGIGLFAAMVDDAAGSDEPVEDAETAEMPSLLEVQGIEPSQILELGAGALVLLMFCVFAMNADKNGSKIFLPADVNLLFPSPMKPQSVLMFRLGTQIGIAVLGAVYMLFQLPNLTLNMGLPLWAALSLVAGWGLTMAAAVLIQLALYTLSATYPAVKRNLRRGIYLILALIAAGFIAFAARSGEGWLKAAVLFFNAPVTRWIPFWGWIKGFCAFAAEGNITGVLLTLLATLLGGAALVWAIWRVKADFYEDAMAKSEETAELLARAQSEKSSGVVVRRKKDRSEKLLRDGFDRGSGANVYFWKAMYNRRRFAHLDIFTKTMETYLTAAILTGAVCRFAEMDGGGLVVALVLGAMAFFRSLGNPLEQDTKMDFFLLIPESTWAKLFWSLMGGTVNCLLDVLPAILLGTLAAGGNVLVSLLYVPLIVSVDFYATTVGVFISLSVPVSAGKTLKQVVQIMFVYFGLLPDILIATLGIVFGHTAAALMGVAALNMGLGFVFFGLAPLFIDPKGGRRREADTPAPGDPKEAKKQFSRLGFAAFTILVVGSLLQLAAGALVGSVWPENQPGWALWAATFAPLYLIAFPLGLLLMRRVPAAPRKTRPMRPGRFLTAAAVSIFAMYAGNLVGTLLLALIQFAVGTSAQNPLLTYAMDDNLLLRALVMAVAAPLVEEYVFRKQLIDRMSPYGEKLAVVTSALVFGLFHGNLSQFIYATALGLIFGYVYLKTGRLRYTAALHMLVNFMGSVIAPAVLEMADLEAIANMETMDTTALASLLPFLLFVLAVLVLSVTGLVLFCVNVRCVTFDPAPKELPRGRRLRSAFLNPGMIVFTLLCIVSVVLTFAV